MKQAKTTQPSGDHTITRMEPQARRPDRYNIWLDGRFALGLDGALALGEGLSVGRTLTNAEIARLRVAEQEQSLFDAAMRFLGARPRSRAEVRQRLLRAKPGRPSKRATVYQRQRMQGQAGTAGGSEQDTEEAITGSTENVDAELDDHMTMDEAIEEMVGVSEGDVRAARLALVERVLDRLERLGLVDDAAFASFWAEQRERFSPRAARAITQELRQHGVDRAIAAEASDPDHDEEQALLAARQRSRSLHTDDYATFRTRLGGFLQRRGFGYEIAGRVIRTLWAEAHEETPDDDDE